MNNRVVEYSDSFRKELKELRELPDKPRRDESFTAIAQRIDRMAESGGGVSARDFERYIGRNDLLRVNYLERGVMAARAVCRIYVADPFGGGGEWGTGFLVSPRLLVTNNHVIKSSDTALRSFAEFGYELDMKGSFRPSKRFQLMPQLGFISDRDLDLTLVAVAERSEDGSAALLDYSFLRLNPNLHKVDEMEFVTIIQHPNGEDKHIAVRENEVIKIGDRNDSHLDNWLWYASDTAPGSSGAPVFNDQWQVVAVHHAGVPETRERDGIVEYQLTNNEWLVREEAERLPDDRVKWVANEGVRTSKLIAKVLELHSSQTERSPLVQEFLDDAMGVRTFPGTPSQESVVRSPILTTRAIESAPDQFSLERRRIPKIKMRPLSYYDGRQGYDLDFLGVTIPLPQLTDKALRFGSLTQVQGASDKVLRYTNFSVVFNEKRRMAFFTAVNIDGKRWVNLKRGNDEWYFDPRLPMELQIGDELYGSEPGNYFDRGHLTRRLDPVWGDMAALADEDTFHWTNCAPQYWEFNQGKELWQGLENFILYNTDQEDVRASVFTGPLFQDDDEEHRGVLIPQYFWKVVVVTDRGGKLYASAYVVSQKQFAKNIPFEKLPVGDFNNFQVSIGKLEQRTGLAFSNDVRAADVFKDGSGDRRLRSFGDIVHPRR